MQRLFIFAIGGTGSRVLRALNYLLAAGVKGMDTDTAVYPLIIDYDKDNGDLARTRKALENYQGLHKLLYKKHATPSAREKDIDAGGRLFQTTVQPISAAMTATGSKTDFWMVFAPDAGAAQYKDAIQYSALVDSLAPTRLLLDSLYDTSLDRNRAELEIDMTVGFQGNPNIGSVVFNGLKDAPEFQDFQSIFTPETDRVLIVGSLFGGTGASGIPAILNAIKGDGCPPKMLNANVAALMVLPYFAPEEKDDSQIHANLFNSKTKAALNFYKTSGLNDKFSAIYYVGDQNPTVILNHDGGSAQLNAAHPVELIGALAAIHFLKSAAPGAARHFKYGMGCELFGESGKKQLQLTDFWQDAMTRDSVLTPLCEAAMAMKCFTDLVEAKKYTSAGKLKKALLENSDATPAQQERLREFLGALHEFNTGFRGWLKEMESGQERSVKFFNMDGELHKLFDGAPQVDKKTGWLSSKEQETPRFTMKDMETQIDAAFSAVHAQADTTGGIETKELEYALTDVLRRAAHAFFTGKTANTKPTDPADKDHRLPQIIIQ